ncbi:MAG: hypothetical protein C4525_06010 [Desulfarculus sp.]|jgi:hypothetical protein|nr:MAG: hypothetical protein C4525_06010 [Desulfarculus sp.]
MFKKLFKHGGAPAAPKAGAAEGGKDSKPRDLHAAVGRDLVTRYQQDPDWVWKLKQVMRPSDQGEHIYNFRVFDPNQTAEKRVSVRGYGSLDEHPELILFHGWLNKKNNDAQVLAGGGEQQGAS